MTRVVRWGFRSVVLSALTLATVGIFSEGAANAGSQCAAQAGGGSGTCCSSDDTCIFSQCDDPECPPPVIVTESYWYTGGDRCPD